jgi:REP element-mobilizing transposase RayT
MAYVRNWLHCVWGTKNREHFLRGRMKYEIIDHIRKNAKKKDIYIDFINGHLEHIHCLILLSPDMTLGKAVQLIKGESSHWINKSGLMPDKFEWADEYFAASVSESDVPKVRGYIKNQEEHHCHQTWEDEYRDYLLKHGFQEFEG